jgi:hypothetical protein
MQPAPTAAPTSRAPAERPPALHRTAAQLAEHVARISAAPTDGGRLAMIVRRPAPLVREVVDEAVLDPALGLVGDSWSTRTSRRTPDGSPHPGMQLTLMSTRVADALTGADRGAWPLAGDQLYVDLDLSTAALPAGTHLQVGEAVVEISAVPHTGCALFAGRFGPEALRFVNTGPGRPGRWRGVNARIVVGGRVAVGGYLRRC